MGFLDIWEVVINIFLKNLFMKNHKATGKYLSQVENIQNPKRKTYAAIVSAVDNRVSMLINVLMVYGGIEATLKKWCNQFC